MCQAPTIFGVTTATPSLAKHTRRHGLLPHLEDQRSLASDGLVRMSQSISKNSLHEEVTRSIPKSIFKNFLFCIVETIGLKHLMNHTDKD